MKRRTRMATGALMVFLVACSDNRKQHETAEATQPEQHVSTLMKMEICFNALMVVISTTQNPIASFYSSQISPYTRAYFF